MDEIIEKHHFTWSEQWLVFLLTFFTACSFLAVVVVIQRLHKHRGLDIIFVCMSSLCFLVYRGSIAFSILSAQAQQILFLPIESWHKLSNVFMLIEYCSLIIFLSRISREFEGYILALGICIIIFLQEKDSFSYQYALIPLIFNNLVLICSSALYDKKGSFNPTMVIYGAIWYMVSVVGFLLTFSENLDYYFFFDDLFMVSTAFSMFYSWQSFQVETDEGKPAQTLYLREVPHAFVQMLKDAYMRLLMWRDDVRAMVRKRRAERQAAILAAKHGRGNITVKKKKKKRSSAAAQEDVELTTRKIPLEDI